MTPSPRDYLPETTPSFVALAIDNVWLTRRYNEDSLPIPCDLVTRSNSALSAIAQP